jgi:hypothetical protein
MPVEIIAAAIGAIGAVLAAWIDRDRFRHSRHVNSIDLQKLDHVIVSQRRMLSRQRAEILSLRKYVDEANRNGYIE